MLQDYGKRFHLMVEELGRHPDVIVTHYHQGNPATEEDIAGAGGGRPLSESLEAFYRQCNGLSLQWKATTNDDDDVSVTIHPFGENCVDALDNDHFMKDYDRSSHGVVNIPDIKSLYQWDWKNAVWHDDDDDDMVDVPTKEQIRFHGLSFPSHKARDQSILPFDGVSKDFCMSMLWKRDASDEEHSEPPLLLGQDSHADYTLNQPTTIENYLECILAQKGLVDARKYYFGYASSTNGSGKTAFEKAQETDAAPMSPPRKPLSVFFQFSKKYRRKAKELHPEAGFGEIAKILLQMFKDLPEVERKQLEDEKAVADQKYAEDLAMYEAQLAYANLQCNNSNGWFHPSDVSAFWQRNQLDVEDWVQKQKDVDED